MRRILASYGRSEDQNNIDLDKLCNELDQHLTDTFEDNIVMQFAQYELPEDRQADESRQKSIMIAYTRARQAYIDAVANIIQNPDSLDVYVRRSYR